MTPKPKPGDLCICGHVRQAHERNHNVGTDCGVCGRIICPRFIRTKQVVEK